MPFCWNIDYMQDPVFWHFLSIHHLIESMIWRLQDSIQVNLDAAAVVTNEAQCRITMQNQC